jgi:hypothetical protein
MSLGQVPRDVPGSGRDLGQIVLETLAHGLPTAWITGQIAGTMDGAANAWIGAAPTYVPGQRDRQLPIVGVGLARQQGHGGQHHPRRAEPALQGPLLQKSSLHGM